MAYNLAMATLVGVMDAAALDAKQEKLFATLAGLGRVIVAYSGGTDSAYLAWAAHQTLGERALSVTALSPSFSAFDREQAESFALSRVASQAV